MPRNRRRRTGGSPKRLGEALRNRESLQDYCEDMNMRLSVHNGGHHWIVVGCAGELRIDWWPSTARAVRGNSADRFEKQKQICTVLQMIELIQQELEEIFMSSKRVSRWVNGVTSESRWGNGHRKYGELQLTFDEIVALSPAELLKTCATAEKLDKPSFEALKSFVDNVSSDDDGNADPIWQSAIDDVADHLGKPPVAEVKHIFDDAEALEQFRIAGQRFQNKADAAAMVVRAQEQAESSYVTVGADANAIVQKDLPCKPKKRWLRWPRGKYNGQRIVGIDVKLRINIRQWRLKPVTTWQYTGGIHWLCFMSWWNFNFED